MNVYLLMQHRRSEPHSNPRVVRAYADRSQAERAADRENALDAIDGGGGANVWKFEVVPMRVTPKPKK